MTCLSDDLAPCSASCPSGDCAGCAFPPPSAPSVCEPSHDCPQRERCAIARHPDAERNPLAPVIDGTVVWAANAGKCPLFRDVRAEVLRLVLAPAYPAPACHSAA